MPIIKYVSWFFGAVLLLNLSAVWAGEKEAVLTTDAEQVINAYMDAYIHKDYLQAASYHQPQALEQQRNYFLTELLAHDAYLAKQLFGQEFGNESALRAMDSKKFFAKLSALVLGGNVIDNFPTQSITPKLEGILFPQPDLAYAIFKVEAQVKGKGKLIHFNVFKTLRLQMYADRWYVDIPEEFGVFKASLEYEE
ncbi:hypothetical protein [Zooshikella sp. RANM57]|uniref:hypothetical protein n=1 Tax=Zooshikella sp. RANM57 TaxID=3425863 RepID=UPI003D6FF1FB